MKKAEIILVIATLAGFAVLTLFSQGEPAQIDRNILAAFRHDGAPIGPKWLLEAARSITALGGHTLISIIVVLVASYLVLLGDRLTAAFVMFAAVSGTIINTLLKAMFDRARPDVVSHLTDVFTASFPSGHAALQPSFI